MTEVSLLVLGNANIDLVLGEIDGWPEIGTEVMVERSEMRAGGSAGNTSLALSGMGIAPRFIASTGNDPNGQWLRQQFDASSCTWLTESCDTTLTVGIVHAGGDRVFFTTPGHLQQARISELIDHTPDAPDEHACAFVPGGFLMPDIRAGTAGLLHHLQQLGWRTAIDPGWPPSGWDAQTRQQMREWMALADYSLLNQEEILGLADIGSDIEAAARSEIGNLRPQAVLVVKCGAAGAIAFPGSDTFRFTGPPVKVKDTVGAGDTFNAAFLAERAGGGSIADALESGVLTAARAISSFPRVYR